MKTAVQELHDPAAPVPGAIDGEQLQLPALPLDRAENREAVVRGRGRPPGAKNKNTEAWREYLLARYSSPLEALAQISSMSVKELGERMADMCGWSKPYTLTWDHAMELLKLQLNAAKELAPYVHQKMPLALEGGEGGLIQLVINANATVAAAGPQGAGAVIEVLNEQPQGNQVFSENEIENSHPPASHNSGEVIDIEGQSDDETR